VTAGIISALGRDIGSGPYDFLQIDAAVNRGNSGGPTFNLEGEVVGVNTAIYSPGSNGGNVGIAFAVPAKVATEVIEQLKTAGSVSRGWLGVKIQDVDEDIAASIGVKDAKGALVNEVTTGGPAAASGLKTGSITAVNGAAIGNSRELARKIAEFAPTPRSTSGAAGRRRKRSRSSVGFPGDREVAKERAAEASITGLGSLGTGVGIRAEGFSQGRRADLCVDGDSDAATKG
jgi:serine protease Do